MTKHTPGKWEVTPKADVIRDVKDKYGRDIPVARCLRLYDADDGIEQMHANAQLIAKAPEMLVELEIAHCMFSVLSNDKRFGKKDKQAFLYRAETIDKLIAEAKGEIANDCD
jgi:hypothetical protein